MISSEISELYVNRLPLATCSPAEGGIPNPGGLWEANCDLQVEIVLRGFTCLQTGGGFSCKMGPGPQRHPATNTDVEYRRTARFLQAASEDGPGYPGESRAPAALNSKPLVFTGLHLSTMEWNGRGARPCSSGLCEASPYPQKRLDQGGIG